MTIAIFDSGIGGLCLLSELAYRLPNCKFIYYADSENAPFGEKNELEILSLTSSAARFLISRDVDALVLACNTATAVAAGELREKNPHFPIFGMEPAVNQAAKETKSGRILTTATPVTLKSKRYVSLINRLGIENSVISLPLPRLVRFAEDEIFGQRRFVCPEAADYIESEARSICGDFSEISSIVLGCTHFIYFKDEFRRLFPSLPICDGISGTANHIINTLGLREGEGSYVASRTEFIISGRSASTDELCGFNNCLAFLQKQKI